MNTAAARRTTTGWAATDWTWYAPPSGGKAKPRERRAAFMRLHRVIRDGYVHAASLPPPGTATGTGPKPTPVYFLHLVLGEQALQRYVECQEALTRLADVRERYDQSAAS